MDINSQFESLVEQAAIKWFKDLGYEYSHGSQISRDDRKDTTEVVLNKVLMNSLKKINSEVRESCIEDAYRILKTFNYPTIENNNKDLHDLIRNGVKVTYNDESGEEVGEIVKVIDYEEITNNSFVVCNQVTIKGEHTPRIPDILVYINGLPIAIFELKNPLDENATIEGAYRQINLYKKDIPDLFYYNEICVISDSTQSKAGTLSANYERYSAWKSIDDGKIVKDKTSLEVLIKGMFQKERLLDIIRYFITFEDGSVVVKKKKSKKVNNDKKEKKKILIKKMAMYHQYYGVNDAIKETLRATGVNGDKKIGTYWHTQGSGKSLSMVFYTGKIRQVKVLENPTIVVITDRNDLDDQLYETFCMASDLIAYPIQANSVENLQDNLDDLPAGGIIFTTIQKFQSEKGDTEGLDVNKKLKKIITSGNDYPLLSDRSNIIVMCDEAHRSNYDFLDGFAKNIRQGLPNASFIGFTGTPIDFEDKSTLQVFGDYISVYDMKQAVEDNATVPIYYESKVVKLSLNNDDIDFEFEEVTESEEDSTKSKLKSKWAALEALAGTEERLNKVANEIVTHFEKRLKTLDGKGMIVCMSRRICVDLYNKIKDIRPEWHSDKIDEGAVKIIMSGNVSKDPDNFAPHILSKTQMKEIESRMKDPEDSLKLVIVRDMWLTGFDAPSVHTMYIDKPMKGHNLMQTIARVNRVFKDKPAGLVVDFIGLAEDLKNALTHYTKSTGGNEAATFPINEALRLMKEKHDICKAFFHGLIIKDWENQEPHNKLTLLQKGMEIINTAEEVKNRFLKHSTELNKAYALVAHDERSNLYRSDIAFILAVKSNVIKYTPPKGKGFEKLDSAIKQIVSEGVAAEGEVIDIFEEAGLKTPDLSILSEEFLDKMSGKENENLQIELLRKLLNDEIKNKQRKNEVKYKSFKDMLENMINQYHNRALTSAQIIKNLVDMANEMKKEDSRTSELNMTEEEIAFYDIVKQGHEAILEDEKTREIAKDLVRIIREKTQNAVDWTNKEDVQANIRSTVKRLLKRKGIKDVEDLDNTVNIILKQAINLFDNSIA
ncbi:type I restriction endonuclease subunit R [Clostridium botulinum]|uniref:type I restriction endonuclease subunit R n=1 Tax=Clostridium botulinum TaxID=1491 RepID=UPI001C9B6253|nr:type I restriction endonuclease subunit R [Clostridium botulinum]MBY6809363.1 type I restriction endonuclease subunit R [Clostridium botulinum]MBY6822805.1 type I restriction endonuclease subunit R [Clostridium botulinum]MBY6833417.1 type I restriction endonuclease subunit R [Clostridium botulinum]MBY6971478.1 type I restriction endonuclease subunit R [Clostridium botulinum]HBJ1649205.1 type I restriction endonuclease subunit R [Clostridium botulinum]